MKPHVRRPHLTLGLLSLAGLLLAPPLGAQVTQLVSLSGAGSAANADCFDPRLSADGRYVAFASDSTNLVAGDVNGFTDVFVHDRIQGTTELVSVSTSGAQGDKESVSPSISADGRYVAFKSKASNLAAGDTNLDYDVFVRDRLSGTTELVSIAPAGTAGNGASAIPSISADGRYVAFESYASDLVPGDTNQDTDVFVRDRLSGTTELASVATGGAEGNSGSSYAAISPDCRYVAFHSNATNLVASDTNGTLDVFVRDRIAGTTELVSVATGGAQGNFWSQYPSISADGRYVAFQSFATNLVASDTNGTFDVFVRDRVAGTTEKASLATDGTQGNASVWSPSISADGRLVSFYGSASNLVVNDLNGVDDVFVHDRLAGTTGFASLSTNGALGNGMSSAPAFDAEGRFLVFESLASNLVAGDTNGRRDVFVRDLNASGFTSLCSPGLDGVISCPCGNNPAGADRGCDNSSSTGGAHLSASGHAYLSGDSLLFTAVDEGPSSLSILLQGDSSSSGGTVFGQGVLCAGGLLKRLYSRVASGGSVTLPDSSVGDPSVSDRSTQLGYPIFPGESRWYAMHYRDPIVPAGCPASSTYNVTQTGWVSWQP